MLSQTFGDYNGKIEFVRNSGEDGKNFFTCAEPSSWTGWQSDIQRGIQVLKSTQSQGQSRQQSRSVYKEFLIVGVSDESASDAVATAQSPSFAQPSLFYSHILQGAAFEECDRRKVIKDFCFPDGVEIWPITSVNELKRALSAQSELQQTYHGFTLNSSNEMALEDQSFVLSQNNGGFALSKLELQKLGQAKEIGLNCLCIIFSDLIVLANQASCSSEDLALLSEDELKSLMAQNRVLRTKRAFCLMFTNQLYQMHMNILSALLETYKQSKRQVF